MIKLIIISLCLSSISYTITSTTIFEWFRNLIKPLPKKVNQLVNCPYCLSHWLLIIGMLFFYREFEPYEVFAGDYLLNLIVNMFAIIAMSGGFHYFLFKAKSETYKSAIDQTLAELEETDEKE